MRDFISSLLSSALLSLTLTGLAAAQVDPALDDSLGTTHRAVEKELTEFAASQGYTVPAGATAVDTNPAGYAAIALLETDVINIDLVAGSDVAAVYYSPDQATASTLPGGFYLTRLRFDANGGTELAYVDRAGKTVYTAPVDLQLKAVAPNQQPETAGASLRINQEGTGVLAPVASLHGHCWIVDVGHGSCWLFPIARIAAAN